MNRAVAGFVLAAILVARAGEGGQAVAPASSEPPAAPAGAALPFAIDGPPPPIFPDVISRDGAGHATVRAVRLTEPLRVDGRLDEAIYETVPAISDFIQQEPDAGRPATQKTEAWLFFDRDKVYVTFRCWESNPERMVVSEMRRDLGSIGTQNERVAFVFDSFYDRRNGFLFIINPIGGRLDAQITERQVNFDWNPIWTFATGRFEGGWTMEAAVPFKSLRYRPGETQIWGVQLQRLNRWKNEWSAVVPLPNSLGIRGLTQTSLGATMVGLEAPAGSKNIEIKPYAVADLATDLNATPKVVNDRDGNVGVDMKYGISQNLTADFTYNTDFAQVEADEQQINLTRFNLFFPEKREFFLENLGTFSFGGAAVSGTAAGASDTPVLFYSRRIGLNQVGLSQRLVPIEGGGRLTGRLGRYSFGVLNIQAGREPLSGSPSTNFSVVRMKRDILRRSSVGILATARSVGQSGTGTNHAYGVDGVFAFFTNLSINTYWARTRTTGLSDEDTSYRAQVDYTGDRYGVQLERLVVGDHFNPEAGFLRRSDMRRMYGQFRFSPRPASIKSIRKFSGIGSFNYIENGAGRLETRGSDGEFAIEFQNTDRFSVAASSDYDFLPEPFRIATGVILPVGAYRYASVKTGYLFGPQRRLSGNISVETGTFYNGHKTAVVLTTGRVKLAQQLSLEPSYSGNWVDLVQGSFTTHLVGSRVTYTMTPRMFVSALPQYNSGSHAITANLRLRWEYQPGSELFVVYNEQRDTSARRFPALANRALVFKINRSFRL